MPKGPEGGGGDGDGGGGDGDGKSGGGEEVAPITRHITQNWRSPSILSRVADMVQAQCLGALPGKLGRSRDGSMFKFKFKFGTLTYALMPPNPAVEPLAASFLNSFPWYLPLVLVSTEITYFSREQLSHRV
jgi:hypothetical protein